MKTVLAILLGGALGAAAMISVDSLSTVGATGARCRLQFGFVAQCDQPFYSVGDTARVSLAHFNFTPTDAFGYSSQGGGFGCTFSVEIEDEAGATVWAPNVGCTDAIVDRSLPSGAVLRASPSVPLVDLAGAPLPAGAYRFRVTSQFNGPSRESGDFGARFGNPEALIPFRIE